MRLLRDISVVWRRGPRALADVLVSIWELALANRTLRRTAYRELLLLHAEAPGAGKAALSLEQAALVERVAYVIPVIGLRVPWRSDCLVQALAGRRWLARKGVTSDVCLGVRKDDLGFQAHAWLKVGERIVTGGDISSYAELPPAHAGRYRFGR